jgi:hypothetical protein
VSVTLPLTSRVFVYVYVYIHVTLVYRLVAPPSPSSGRVSAPHCVHMPLLTMSYTCSSAAPACRPGLSERALKHSTHPSSPTQTNMSRDDTKEILQHPQLYRLATPAIMCKHSTHSPLTHSGSHIPCCAAKLHGWGKKTYGPWENGWKRRGILPRLLCRAPSSRHAGGGGGVRRSRLQSHTDRSLLQNS